MASSVTISNNHFSATVSTIGAELKSVKHVQGTEFIWQGVESIWPRCAPVLFPIVGKLKNDELVLNGQRYPLTQHGFARDMEFTLLSQTPTSVMFKLVHDDSTLLRYPFEFELILGYTWQNDKLVCSYEVHNPAETVMPFSIGAHPGFNTPENILNAYVLEFEHAETQERHLLSNGLFNGETAPILQQSRVLPLSKALFDKDAIVCKHLASKWIKLKHRHSNYAVKMSFDGFPYFGIWSKKQCEQYVCLEPWFGHADGVEGHEDFYSRVGTILLKPKTTFNAAYTLEFDV